MGATGSSSESAKVENFFGVVRNICDSKALIQRPNNIVREWVECVDVFDRCDGHLGLVLVYGEFLISRRPSMKIAGENIAAISRFKFLILGQIEKTLRQFKAGPARLFTVRDARLRKWRRVSGP